MSLRSIKFMLLMLCLPLKMYCFQIFMIFCQRKLQLSRNRMRLKLTSFSFQVKRNILLKKENIRGRRTCWVKKGRTSAWWDKFLNNEVMDSDWLENFRMSKTSFEKLVNILRPYLGKQVARMRKPISTEGQIALYYSIDEARYRKTTNSFGMSRGSVSLIIRKVSKAIVEFLRKDYMKLPESLAKVEKLTQIFRTPRIPTVCRSNRWYAHTNTST